MLVFFDQKLVFFAMPKTGSTAIEHALSPFADMEFKGNPQNKHIPPRRFNRLIRPYVQKFTGDDLTKIALMREPLDWLGSWYRYRQRDTLVGHQNSTKEVSFNEFIEQYLKTDRPAYADLGSQYKFLRLRDDNIDVHKLFKYENMGIFVQFMSKQLNQDINLEKLNASPKGNLTLSPSLKRNLEDALKKDFDLYETI